MSRTRFITTVSRFCSTFHVSSGLPSSPACNLFERHTLFGTQGLGYRYLSDYTRSRKYNTSFTRNFSIISGVPADSQSPTPPSPTNFLSWILGIALTVVLPFTNKWGTFLKLKKDVDDTVEIVEEIAEVVEKVAEVVDKVAEDIAGGLPDGGKFKKVVEVVEDMAEKTAKDAHMVEDAIKKFQEAEEDVRSIVQTLAGYHEDNKHQKEATTV